MSSAFNLCKSYSAKESLTSLLTNRNLGISDTYFAVETPQTICDHILALYGAKIMAFTKHSNSLDIDLEHATEDGAVFIHSSAPGRSPPDGPQWEKK